MKVAPIARRTIGPVCVEVVIGDIAFQPDIVAIVNASSRHLMPGGGVSGSVFAAAGFAQLSEACKKLAPIDPGQAVVTSAFGLPNRCIIHCCGPQFKPGSEAADVLAATYWSILELAEQNAIDSLAIPAIATGSYGFPIDLSAQIAIDTIKGFSPNAAHLKLIHLVLRDGDAARSYASALLKPPTIPNNKIELSVLTTKYSRKEFDVFSRGCIGDQDSKWYVYFADPWLYIYRGNLKYGRGCFWLRFVADDQHAVVAEAWMDPELPWNSNESCCLVEDILNSRFGLLEISEEKEQVGGAGCWITRDKIALSSRPVSYDELLSPASAIELGRNLISLGELLQRRRTVRNDEA
jgi:O-acetyl-ADP-ribose deacetylase